jgi:hypothetical protein
MSDSIKNWRANYNYVIKHDIFKNNFPDAFRNVPLDADDIEPDVTCFGLTDGKPFFVHDNGCYFEFFMYENECWHEKTYKSFDDMPIIYDRAVNIIKLKQVKSNNECGDDWLPWSNEK